MERLFWQVWGLLGASWGILGAPWGVWDVLRGPERSTRFPRSPPRGLRRPPRGFKDAPKSRQETRGRPPEAPTRPSTGRRRPPRGSQEASRRPPRGLHGLCEVLQAHRLKLCVFLTKIKEFDGFWRPLRASGEALGGPLGRHKCFLWRLGGLLADSGASWKRLGAI